MSATTAIAQVLGRVQGVGFPAWARRAAVARSPTGSAADLSDGRAPRVSA